METKKPNYLHKFAPIFVILAAIFWGILVVFVRAFGKADFGSMEIVTMRVYTSVIFAWIMFLLFDHNSQRKNHKSTRNSQHSQKTHTTPTKKLSHPTLPLKL